MSEAKPTPGEWEIELYQDGGWCVFVSPTVDFGVTKTIAQRGQWPNNAEESHANGSLLHEAGKVHHQTGLTPSQLVARVSELEDALRAYERVHESLFVHCLSNGVFNAWGKAYNCTELNNAHLNAEKVLKK